MKVASSLASLMVPQIVLSLLTISGAAQSSSAVSAEIGSTSEHGRVPVLLTPEPAAPVSSSADLVEAPEPASSMSGDGQKANVPWAAERHQQPFSRVALGADVGPLGIGIKSAVVLTEYLDARALVNFFNYDTGIFEIEGFRTDARFHLLSAGAAIDCYPRNSFWRLSGGLFLANQNELVAKAKIVPGTSFTVDSQDFYSSKVDPVNGTGVLGMHRHSPAFMASFGFGKFIPRSNRHWSFPTEFGVVFTGAPTVNVKAAGSVCADAELTQCSKVNDPGNPVGAAFGSALRAQVDKWQRTVNSVEIYPIFSYSVMYSFNVR